MRQATSRLRRLQFSRRIFVLHPQKHRLLFTATTALFAGWFTYFVTGVLPYYPTSWRALLILAVVTAWFLRPHAGMLLALATFVLPLAYNSPFGLSGIIGAGGAMLLAALMLTPFSFLVLAGATVCASQPSLAMLLLVAPLALGVLQPRRAALTAAIVCAWVEILMLALGFVSIGVLQGGELAYPLITPRREPVASLLDFGWGNVRGGKTEALQFLFANVSQPFVDRPILLAQIALWALAAGVMGLLIHRTRPWTWLEHLPMLTRSISTRTLYVGSGMLIVMIGQIILSTVLPSEASDVGATVADSLLAGALVLLVLPVLELVPYALSPTTRVESRSLTSSDTAEGDAQSERRAGSGRSSSSRRDIPRDTWTDLAGVDDLRAEVQEAIASQFDTKLRASLKSMNLRPTRGILLYGPPGTGKTKIARIIAHDAQAAFFAVSGTEFTSKWYGESEANLRRIFNEAQANRPAVLFFDELEAFLPKRADLSRSDAPEKGVVATFLAYTDGIANMDGVLLVGATNYPNVIDPAALRPGRFDKVLYVSPPDRDARMGIFESYLKSRPLAPDIDMQKLASRTERFTGADIQSVCTEAARKALRRAGNKPEPITMADLETAIGGVKPSVSFQMLRDYQAIADQYGRRSERHAATQVIARTALTWDDVAGLQTVKDALHETIELPLVRPELFTDYGIKPSKGVLLFGPPGCGKTFLAKVVASASGAHFLHVKGPELLQRYVGQSEAQLRDLFERARDNTPCVLFFDELDALAGARGTNEGASTQIVTQFLTEMDGVDELKGVIIVGATNRPDTLDPALLRPGRFDRVLYVPPPDQQARLSLIQHELAGKPVAEDVDYVQLADKSDGYSAADITAICNAAATATAKDALQTGERQVITMQRLLTQFARTTPSITAAEIREYEALRDRLQR